MSNDAQGDHQSHINAGLKANPDCHTVQETVQRQPGCGHRPKLRLMHGHRVHVFTGSVQSRVTLQPEKGQESNRSDWHV